MTFHFFCSTCIATLITCIERQRWPVFRPYLLPLHPVVCLAVKMGKTRKRKRIRRTRAAAALLMRNKTVLGLAAQQQPSKTNRKWINNNRNVHQHISNSSLSVWPRRPTSTKSRNSCWRRLSRSNQTVVRVWSAVTFTREWTATLPKNSSYIQWRSRQRHRPVASRAASALPINATFAEHSTTIHHYITVQWTL